jgi:hypothetical protein
VVVIVTLFGFSLKILVLGTIGMLMMVSAADISISASEAKYSGLVEEEIFGGLGDDSLWYLKATLKMRQACLVIRRSS